MNAPQFVLVRCSFFGTIQRRNRGAALVKQHSSKTKEEDASEEPPALWDHSRDMSLGGRLMDDKSREKMIKDARGLGDRFGSSKSGGFL